ncbi:unnamed protein product [Amoebophrya sp. A120]|nr:unnamed protein product [Amoebophrya sp. A120]|eukprot:GSA120T00012877001.1
MQNNPNSPKVFPNYAGQQAAPYAGPQSQSFSSSASSTMVVGAPMLATGPSMPSAYPQPVMMMVQPGASPTSPNAQGLPLTWDRPRICAECSMDCWLSCACPCLVVDQISLDMKLVGAKFHTYAIGVCVFVRWIADTIRALEGFFYSSAALYDITVLATILVSAVCGIFLMRWKSSVGSFTGIGSGEVLEDFICMWCCPCHHIPAVQRTVANWRIRGQSVQPAQMVMMSPMHGGGGAPSQNVNFGAMNLSMTSSAQFGAPGSISQSYAVPAGGVGGAAAAQTVTTTEVRPFAEDTGAALAGGPPQLQLPAPGVQNESQTTALATTAPGINSSSIVTST